MTNRRLIPLLILLIEKKYLEASAEYRKLHLQSPITPQEKKIINLIEVKNAR